MSLSLTFSHRRPLTDHCMCIVQWRIDNKENFSQRGGCIIQGHSARAEIHLTYSMHSTYGSFYETVQGISYIYMCVVHLRTSYTSLPSDWVLMLTLSLLLLLFHFYLFPQEAFKSDQWFNSRACAPPSLLGFDVVIVVVVVVVVIVVVSLLSFSRKPLQHING